MLCISLNKGSLNSDTNSICKGLLSIKRRISVNVCSYVYVCYRFMQALNIIFAIIEQR